MTANTKLNKIHIRVGRTGALNPWAQLEPVEVGGVTVSQATLHNEEDINRKDIREGDVVIVQRAGDVIPQVVGPLLPHQPGTKRFRMPKNCPLCGAEIVRPEGEVMHRCPNPACESRGLESLINWVMAAADIEGVGEQLVRRLWALGLVRSIPELYRLTKEQLLELDGFQERSATNAIEAIAGLEGDPVPPRAVRAQHPRRRLGDRAEPRPPFRRRRVRSRTPPRKRSRRSEGIGPERATAIAEWFADEANVKLIEELRELGLRLEIGRGAEAGRGRPHRQHLRDHRHAGALDARAGRLGARGAWREGRRLGLEEDHRRDRRRGAGRDEAEQGARGSRCRS